MSIGNLHALVRTQIPSVNPDTQVMWLQSTDNAVDDAGKSTPAYAAATTVGANIQPVSGSDIRKYEFLQSQGIFRTVYLFGNKQGLVRLQAKGGDLLQFAPVQGEAVCTWLVKQVPETWDYNLGWCRVIVSMQLDPNNPQAQV